MIKLSLPPSVNQIYRIAKWGRMFMTKEGKAWKEQSAWIIKQALKPMKKISVTVRIYFRDLRRRDLDNMEKLIADSITMSGIIKDDNWQILNEWHVSGALDKDDPRIELEIKEII